MGGSQLPSRFLSMQRPEHEQPHGAAAWPLPPPPLPGGAVSRCFMGFRGEAAGPLIAEGARAPQEEGWNSKGREWEAVLAGTLLASCESQVLCGTTWYRTLKSGSWSSLRPALTCSFPSVNGDFSSWGSSLTCSHPCVQLPATP